MQTRSDHVQAYRDGTDRMSTALLSGDAFSGKPPLKRSTTGALFGAIVALLVCVGAYVYGLIFPGGNVTWQQPGTVVVEKETGNRYLYLAGQLRPTLNTASALLVLNTAAPPFTNVSRASLGDTPVGAPIGIPEAPDRLPDNGVGLPGRWSQCAVTGAAEPQQVIALGSPLPTGPVGDARVLVAAPDALYVVWRDQAHRVDGPGTLSALGLSDVVPVPVTADWLGGFTGGAPLGPPEVPGDGEPGPVVAGAPAQVGQVFTVSVNGSVQTYLLREDGLAPIGPTGAALLAARPGAAPERAIGPADVAALPTSADRSGIDGVPELLGADTVRPGGDGDPDLVCLDQTSSPEGVLAPGTLSFTSVPVAPQQAALLTPGTGMLASPLPVPERGRPALQFLVTDQGICYPLSTDAARVLMPSAAPVWLPPAVLAALPAGPPLVTGVAALTGLPAPAPEGTG